MYSDLFELRTVGIWLYEKATQLTTSVQRTCLQVTPSYRHSLSSNCKNKKSKGSEYFDPGVSIRNSDRRDQSTLTPLIPSELPDDNSEREPPDSIPNSEVKPLSADGSVGSPHVRVGHCQASNNKPHPALRGGVFYWMRNERSPLAGVIVIRNLA